MPSEPTVLAFDTSAAHCAAALLRAGRIVATRVEPMTRGQAERLMPLLEELLAETDTTWADLSAIGVGTGPGNFTGIRISVAAARGLALGLDIPAIGITSFEALSETTEDRFTLPAPRGRRYVQTLRHAAPLSDIVLEDGEAEPFDAAAAVAAMARLAALRVGTPQPAPAPVYLRPADAAPPSDPPPVILP
ncbi:MAG: tRNA (adenosine(37)-N6)-threonylcarbamoyltransferase complex dimerization subunit type 1 TsaB [Rhodobacterales bacterium]|nr:MAG: tRNA (adenosine(37)-N6)-threonylcarbamoyltransferase complex dimerization subunit type 1 TsaB [Rhodobacterales bacterium]